MNLTPPEIERLACLSEELGESQQVIGKILRHGWESSYHGPTNRELLEQELGDVLAIMRLLRVEGEINMERVYACADRKLAKLGKWAHYQSQDSLSAARNNL